MTAREWNARAVALPLALIFACLALLLIVYATMLCLQTFKWVSNRTDGV